MKGENAMIKPTKILTNSTFSDTTIPYRAVIDGKKRLIAVACSFHAQWQGRAIEKSSKSVQLYGLDTLEPINSVDTPYYPVNGIAFHPKEEVVALGTGCYDGGDYFEGELLLWNYRTNVLDSVLDRREVTRCSFSEDGGKLSFTLNPVGTADRFDDQTDKKYEVDYPVQGKICPENIQPVSITKHIDNWEHGNIAGTVSLLSDISSQKNRVYKNRNMIWDMVFIGNNALALARNDATVEIWDIETETVKEIKLPRNGDCVEIFFNDSNNSLLVNLWDDDIYKNKLFSINLSDLRVRKIADCNHTISQSKGNYFLARQADFGDKMAKDYILDPNYRKVFEKRRGHYDLFNHYLRIDNSELLYFVAGNPPTQHKNKAIYSINPADFEIKEVWQIEKHPQHYNNFNGIKIGGNLILSGYVYSTKPGDEIPELFCVDLEAQKKKWTRHVDNQVCSFGIINNGAVLVAALSGGQIELIETASGKTVEVVKRGKYRSFAMPLSVAAFGDVAAVGLANGEVELYVLKENTGRDIL